MGWDRIEGLDLKSGRGEGKGLGGEKRVKGGEGKEMFLSLKLDFQTVLQLSLALSFISEPLYLDSAELDEIRCIPCIKRKYKTISNILLLNIFSFSYSKKPCFDKE